MHMLEKDMHNLPIGAADRRFVICGVAGSVITNRGPICNLWHSEKLPYLSHDKRILYVSFYHLYSGICACAERLQDFG